MNKDHHRDPGHQPRRDSNYEPHRLDPYHERMKLAEPTVCPDCAAIYHGGRWQWGTAPDAAAAHRCPACSRIQDGVPAARLSLRGGFFHAHRDEIMQLVRNFEAREKTEHPLERIMDIEEDSEQEAVVVSFTGIHLARGTGEALRHAYQGEFSYSFTDRDDVFYGSWERDGGKAGA